MTVALCQVYATSMAMLLTMVISIQLFEFRPTLQVCNTCQILIPVLPIQFENVYNKSLDDVIFICP